MFVRFQGRVILRKSNNFYSSGSMDTTDLLPPFVAYLINENDALGVEISAVAMSVEVGTFQPGCTQTAIRSRSQL